ncbi:MAG: di-trans,poly-cis-decaprenylcistransferase [Clostridia bacterium]|nr:di-trans,poly-cis-decaprenylcistransferase [Clostridia bacterium]
MKKLFKRDKSELDLNNLPQHVAIIMDGNGRWAQKRGLMRSAGHLQGSNRFRSAAKYFQRIGIKYFTVYAFSTDNWKRPKEEVDGIFELLEKYLYESIDDMKSDNIVLNFWGDLSRLSPKLLKLIGETDELSLKNDGMHVNVCLNYGGRAEILRAAKSFAADCREGKLTPDALTEEEFESRLYSANTPPPDLLIRPGGETRISNFLLWQLAYTEMVFTDVLWPDLTDDKLEKILIDYQHRNRRYGGI